MLILPFCGHPAADVALPFVFVQNFPNLKVQRIIVLLQPLGQVFMHRGFGNAEVPGGGPDGGTGFDHVHSRFTGSLLNGVCHMLPLRCCVLRIIHMRPKE